jgi:hypothetical protein
MSTFLSEALYDSPSQPSYEVRVRGTERDPTYLWGSAGITENISFDKPLVLHIRNDVFGEAITLGTQTASKARKTIGTLQPGECISIPVQGISGVYAICTPESNESTVACIIKHD